MDGIIHIDLVDPLLLLLHLHGRLLYDIQAGLSCLSSSLFWITTERLQMTSFTTPLTIDKVMLYITQGFGISRALC